MKKTRMLPLLLLPLWAAMFLPARAEDEPEFKMPARESFREVVDDWSSGGEVSGRHLIMTVSPAELPYPLLKYRLNTYVTEMGSGNAAPLYSEAYSKLDRLRSGVLEYQVYKSKEYAETMWPKQFDKETLNWSEENDALTRLRFKAFPILSMWTSKVPAEISPGSEEQLYQHLQPVFDLLEKASKKRDCDWSYAIEYKGFATILEHVQHMRELARYLQGKADWEIRNGNYDDAVKTIRIGLRLSEHLKSSDFPCLVTQLVGIAIRGIMETEIRLLSAQPDAPNLYPALTQVFERNDLFQKSLQAEQFWMFSKQNLQETFERMDSASDAELEMLLDEIITLLMIAPSLTDVEDPSYDALKNVKTLACIACYPYGKERLLKLGHASGEIDDMSVYRVVVPYVLEEIKAAYDLMIVAASFPVGAKHTAIVFDDSQYTNIVESPARVYLAMLLPAVQAAQNAYLRQEQSLDLLKITEAIRYYAAVHDGELPKSLEAFEELYVPTINPMTGEPYGYRVEGNKAVIDFYIYGNGDSRLEITVE